MYKKTYGRLRAVLKSLHRGASINEACKGAGIDVVSLWRWRKADQQLDDLIKTAYDSRIQIVEDALYKAALEGNVTAQIFFLKNRDVNRWRDVNFEFRNETHIHNHKLTDEQITNEAAKRGIALPDEIARRIGDASPTKSA